MLLASAKKQGKCVKFFDTKSSYKTAFVGKLFGKASVIKHHQPVKIFDTYFSWKGKILGNYGENNVQGHMNNV